MDAHGALDSLLGRLTIILVNEAQLLGRVRGDVEFIKDEMECMNSLILQLTEAQHRDHLVRAWMKQVVGLTRDCEGNVEHYIHYVGGRPGYNGLLGYLRRIALFLRTMPDCPFATASRSGSRSSRSVRVMLVTGGRGTASRCHQHRPQLLPTCMMVMKSLQVMRKIFSDALFYLTVWNLRWTMRKL
ncbi:unnamed protein product [Urochloa humidicola]